MSSNAPLVLLPIVAFTVVGLLFALVIFRTLRQKGHVWNKKAVTQAVRPPNRKMSCFFGVPPA